ncbi:MAG: hypothetical protein IJ075_01050 [Lachnospiraceae bacterium]|nr:hypothetical protein [Lachnospiraceae bacterium]
MFDEDEICVLCGANSYEKKYYFNKDFSKLPDQVKDTLHIICVEFTEKCGGTFVMGFDEDGGLKLMTDAEEADAMYDEIGAELEIKNLQMTMRQLFEEISLFYKVVFLGEKIDL